MNDTTLNTPQLSRRNLLKVGLLGTALLGTAGLTATLSGCSASTPASGYLILRSSDLPFLRALIPVMLDGAVTAQQMPQAVDGTLKSPTTAWRTCRRRCSNSPCSCSTCWPCPSPAAR